MTKEETIEVHNRRELEKKAGCLWNCGHLSLYVGHYVAYQSRERAPPVYIVAHGMSAIEREGNRMGPLNLPSNAKGREAERERLENTLASSFIAAMRTLPAYVQDCPRVSQMQ